jgi:L-fucose/D-arabinose isomerase
MSSIKVKAALAHVADGRSDFYTRREGIALEEIKSLDWLRQEVDLFESPVLNSVQAVREFAYQASVSGAQSLIIHLPIWADPIFAIKLINQVSLPVLLLGNDRPDSSSMVGLLGAGGALDQIGIRHTRIFEHQSHESRQFALAFLRAAAVVKSLRGQTLGLFGGRSLGIFTASADPAQWQRLFGIDIENLDQCEIIKRAEKYDRNDVSRYVEWLRNSLTDIRYSGSFTPQAFEKQVRSYLATRELVRMHGFDFIGVKCQPEMCDGYVSQCVSHCLMNNNLDADGSKPALVHACESDADGALTMQILNHLSEGRPTALLDMRWYNAETFTWVLANCGAAAAAFFATEADPTGFAGLTMQEHVFGKGGGGAISGAIPPQEVTLARLCRRDGQYWMAILPARTLEMTAEDRAKTTPAFPQASIKLQDGINFAGEFGSNHIHMVAGDYSQELIAFCQIIGIPWKIWR